MGRAFAAAIRDGFRFPLPLSASFLKLVQSCSCYDEEPKSDKKTSHFSTPIPCTENFVCTMPITSTPCNSDILTSSDLPRPGFLGGEIYATENYICKALENLKATSDQKHSEDQLKVSRQKLASD